MRRAAGAPPPRPAAFRRRPRRASPAAARGRRGGRGSARRGRRRSAPAARRATASRGAGRSRRRRADLHRLVHHLADLLGVRLRERTTEDGEVLAEDERQAPVDHAVAGDHAIARHLVVLHAEVVAAVLDEHVPFLERAFVEQQLEPFARAQLALGVLGGDALLATAEPRPGALFLEHLLDVVHGVSAVSGVRGRCRSARAVRAPRSTAAARRAPRSPSSPSARCAPTGDAGSARSGRRG